MVNRISENQKLCGIMSFSELKSDLLMLAYYANDHKGGILEFEVNPEKMDELFFSSNLATKCGKVEYVSSRPLDFYFEKPKVIFDSISFQKHSAWGRESECRIVAKDYRLADCVSIPKDDIRVKYLKNKRIVKDYVIGSIEKCGEIDCEWLAFWGGLVKGKVDFHPLVNIDPNRLTAVYLGCRFPLSELSATMFKKFVNLDRRLFFLDIHPSSYCLSEVNVWDSVVSG